MLDLFLSRVVYRTIASSCVRRAAASSLGVLLITVLVPLTAFAQQATAVLAGRVLDMANDAPIGFASVVVEDAASGQQLSGTLTGENGRFVIQGCPRAPTRFGSRSRASTRPTPTSSSARSTRPTTSATSAAAARGLRGEGHGHRRGDPGRRGSTRRCFGWMKVPRSPPVRFSMP